MGEPDDPDNLGGAGRREPRSPAPRPTEEDSDSSASRPAPAARRPPAPVSAAPVPAAVLRTLARAARSALGRSSPRAPSAAVLHRGDRVLAVGSASAERGALGALLRAAPALDEPPCELVLLVEPEPNELEGDAWRRLGPHVQRIRVMIEDPGLEGAGLRALSVDAGGPVQLGAGLGADLRALVEPWWTATRLGRPHVLLKAATSLDGRIATRTGESKWITGELARARGRRFRGEVDGIVVGVETVLADDPALTRRQAGAHDPLRIVLDARARTPLEAQLVRTSAAIPTLIATTAAAPLERRAALAERGVQIEVLPADPGGRVDLRGLLARLFGLGLRSLMVEGGGQVAGSFVDGGLVDHVAWFLAPMVLGGTGARSAVGGMGPGALSAALRLDDVRIERLGEDLLVTGRARR